jgi:hypothetical protein
VPTLNCRQIEFVSGKKTAIGDDQTQLIGHNLTRLHNTGTNAPHILLLEDVTSTIGVGGAMEQLRSQRMKISELL